MPTAAPPTRAAPRCGRSTGPRWTAGAGNEVIVQSRTADRVMYAARWARCNSCPAPGTDTPATATATARPMCRTCSTRRSAASRSLCSGGLNLRDPSQVMAASLRYNNCSRLCPQRARLGRRVRDGVVAGGSAADHGADPAARRRAPGPVRRPRPWSAAERARAARHRPVGTDAADGARRRRKPDPAYPGSDPRPAARPRPGVRVSGAPAGAAGDSAVAAAVDAGSRHSSRSGRPNARCSALRCPPRRRLRNHCLQRQAMRRC